MSALRALPAVDALAARLDAPHPWSRSRPRGRCCRRAAYELLAGTGCRG